MLLKWLRLVECLSHSLCVFLCVCVCVRASACVRVCPVCAVCWHGADFRTDAGQPAHAAGCSTDDLAGTCVRLFPECVTLL